MANTGIQLSKALTGKLPETERSSIETKLWDKSGGLCWLCEEPMNRAADVIHADHEIPESEGGKTELANLNLAHDPCNKAKRNAKTVPIRPYLKLLAYTKKNGGRLKYDGYLEHFGASPKAVVVSRDGERVMLEMPDGTIQEAPVFTEENTTGVHESIYVTLPRDAIFNDEACQPRAVRTDHAWSIYSDLQRNVLHEPPSCRMETYALGEPVRLLLFDGQHKTVASWMMGRDSVTAKVYLNLTTPQANELVNSIQAKIKKLPLSPFELAGKMSDEWENKFSEYEAAVGATEVSEDGFLKWLPQTERNRGKGALHAALIQNVLSSADLRIKNHVKQRGGVPRAFDFTEQQLKAKVLERLLVKDALTEKGDDAQKTRDAEASNIIRLLNTLNDQAFEPADDSGGMTAIEIARAKRMSYQSSLNYVSGLLRQMWHHLIYTPNQKTPMSATLSVEQEEKMDLAIKRIVEHPVWKAGFDRDERMAAVKAALEKNQEAESAFTKVGLDLAYLVIGEESPAFKDYWK